MIITGGSLVVLLYEVHRVRALNCVVFGIKAAVPSNVSRSFWYGTRNELNNARAWVYRLPAQKTTMNSSIGNVVRQCC